MQEMKEMQVQSPGQEDPMEKEMTTRSSILAWELPRTKEPGVMGSQSDTTEQACLQNCLH